jgi:hypothetical protein
MACRIEREPEDLGIYTKPKTFLVSFLWWGRDRANTSRVQVAKTEDRISVPEAEQLAAIRVSGSVCIRYQKLRLYENETYNLPDPIA